MKFCPNFADVGTPPAIRSQERKQVLENHATGSACLSTWRSNCSSCTRTEFSLGTVDLGLRYDYFDLVDSYDQVSPRVGMAYHFARTKSVLRAAYNRYFSPPPIEYSLLASFIGNNASDPDQRVGNVRAYTQNYFEVGWAQELHPRLSLEVNAYLHSGHDAFENHEISISRIFVPINFDKAHSKGLEVVLNAQQLERLGISGRFQYALSRTYFYGPITGGFAGDEPLEKGERIIPAFDQTHTGTAPCSMAGATSRPSQCA